MPRVLAEAFSQGVNDLRRTLLQRSRQHALAAFVRFYVALFDSFSLVASLIRAG